MGQHPVTAIALNTSTIKGFGLGIERETELAAAAGFDAVEPWVRELETYRDQGGALRDLRNRISDAGLTVAGAIAFFNWADTNPHVRADALEDAKRQIDMVAAVGGSCIAAPPCGNVTETPLETMVESYTELLRAGRNAGVAPLLELWGHAPRLSTLGELLHVALECGSSDVRLLLDIYHLYKGDNAFDSLALLNGNAIGLIHINDYPELPTGTITDRDRVWPGDGIAPFPQILGLLDQIGFAGTVSLELFNDAYWQGDPAEQLRTGLAKTRRALGW